MCFVKWECAILLLVSIVKELDQKEPRDFAGTYSSLRLLAGTRVCDCFLELVLFLRLTATDRKAKLFIASILIGPIGCSKLSIHFDLEGIGFIIKNDSVRGRNNDNACNWEYMFPNPFKGCKTRLYSIL